MVFRCSNCSHRCRDDKSCKNKECKFYRPASSGAHWGIKRLSQAVGDDIANRIGAYVAGGRALTLAHRHDIRVARAAAQILKQIVSDRASRLELLIMLYPCYWRWSTKQVLEVMVANKNQFLAGDSKQLAQIVKGAYDSMTRTMQNHQVVGFQKELRTDLLPRAESKRVCSAKENTYGYHPYSNPSNRRTGDVEFNILLDDIANGSLWRMCRALSEEWQVNPTYKKSEKIIRDSKIKLLMGALYTRTRFRSIVVGLGIPN